MPDNSLDKFWKIGETAPLENADSTEWSTSPSDGSASGSLIDANSSNNENTPAECISANDCGSGFVCRNGKCIEKGRSVGGIASVSGCSSFEPGSGGLKDSDGCQDCATPTCGNGSPGPLNCCGGVTYTHYPGGIKSCDPPLSPPSSDCTSYCTNYLHLHGDYAEGCSPSKNTCGMCEECDLGGDCVERSGAPCFCPGSECKADCEKCADDGSCQETCEGCVDVCNCFVTCPSGKQITNSAFTKPHCDNGLACSAACRQDLLANHCDEATADHKNPCDSDPNDPCSSGCECKTWQLPCGTSVQDACPAGKSCKSLGDLTPAGTYDELGDCIGGSVITHFVRVCSAEGLPEGCDDCDCNCSNDCGDCETCNAAGECVPDQGCSNGECTSPSEPCYGDCCSEGSECEKWYRYRIEDTCIPSNSGYIVAPESYPPRLVRYNSFQSPPEDEGGCGRSVSWCYIYAGSLLLGEHRDCGNGIHRIGVAAIGCMPHRWFKTGIGGGIPGNNQ